MERRQRFPQVDYNRADWPEQVRKIELMRRHGKAHSLKEYKKRQRRLLTVDEEPIRFEAGPPDVPPGVVDTRKHYRFRTYSMPHAQIQGLHRKQDGKCAICCIPIAIYGRTRAVDHCRRTGRLRGMLCKACNLGVGMFRDDPKRMINALVYLGVLERRFYSEIEHELLPHPKMRRMRDDDGKPLVSPLITKS